MDWARWGRVIAIASGAAVLFCLREFFGQDLIVAIPAGVCVYFGLRGVFAALAEEQQKN